MKLKPQQILGLAAIVVFGAGMIFRLTQPSEREIMERRLASLPRLEAPAASFPIPELSNIDIPASPSLSAEAGATAPASLASHSDYATVGSQEAKDDLYCSAVLAEEFDAKIKTDHPDKVAPLLDAQKRLDSAGIAKLKAEGVTDGSDWANFTMSHEGKAKADYEGATLRIPVATCVERASKLPPGDLY